MATAEGPTLACPSRRRHRRTLRLVTALTLAVAGATALAYCAHRATRTESTHDSVAARRKMASATTVVGSILARDDVGITVKDAHGRFVNVRTDLHTIITRSRPARSTDIVGGDNIMAIGTIEGSTIAARWIIDEATPSSQSFSTTFLERIAGRSECRVVMGTVDVVSAKAITIKTASEKHFSVTTSPRTTMTYETTEHVSDLSQGDNVAISGSPDPMYSNVILATLIRIDGANAYPTCRER